MSLYALRDMLGSEYPWTRCSFEPDEWHGQPDFLVNRNYLPFIFGERPAFSSVLDFPCLALLFGEVCKHANQLEFDFPRQCVKAMLWIAEL